MRLSFLEKTQIASFSVRFSQQFQVSFCRVGLLPKRESKKKLHLLCGYKPTTNSRVFRWIFVDLLFTCFGILTKYLANNAWKQENSGFGFGLKFLFTVENFLIKELCQVSFWWISWKNGPSKLSPSCHRWSRTYVWSSWVPNFEYQTPNSQILFVKLSWHEFLC